VNESGQVPDVGDVGQVAPQLFDLSVGSISGPIDAGRTGIVAKIVDKQAPTDEDVKKNSDATREQLKDERQNQAFSLFMGTLMDDYKKHRLIRMSAKEAGPALPGS
jgi:peptidyl-prolyl cis-trans isomerase D